MIDNKTIKFSSMGLVLCAAALVVTACSNATEGDEDPATGVGSKVGLIDGQMNDTGIADCIDVTGKYIDCADANAMQGQDALVGLDVGASNTDGRVGFRFSKLDSTGRRMDPSASYETNPWPCVVDENTGYVWEVKTNDGGLRDRDWVYSWYLTDPKVNLAIPGSQNMTTECFQGTGCDTQTYINELNKIKLCGYSDWRLPNLYELVSIRDFGTHAVRNIDTEYFFNASGGNVWSDVSTGWESLEAYFLRFYLYEGTRNFDSIGFQSKDSLAHVRAVRGGTRYIGESIAPCITNQFATVYGQQTPTSRFTIFDNGTVKDKLTKLMWKQCTEGQVSEVGTCTGTASAIASFAKALDIASTSSFAGYDDWRLPNISELNSILEPICDIIPMINEDVFPNTPNSSYWSSSINVVSALEGTMLHASFVEARLRIDGELDYTASGGYHKLRLVRDTQ